GMTDSYRIIFRSAAKSEEPPASGIESLLSQIENATSTPTLSGLGNLSVLLQASTLLHSRQPLDAVLRAMVDHAITLTNADRVMLLEADASGVLRPRLACQRGGTPLDLERLAPSQTAVRAALEKESSVVTEDISQAVAAFQAAQSIVAQQLRSVV